MQNELHDRLEYLVNYSSQLIFVSGDSIANQQRTLETFVYQQHDDTEIAYLTADSAMDIADYRRQLCRQLLGQVVGSFVRPLNELLSELKAHDGPVLIAITQAQHIPDSLLQELWDLVLQSRFAGNKQHLNVLLFGETAWAERAKQWLPSKNTDTPLLISSQSVHTDASESDLDKLIARRREEFQAHLAQRASLSSTTTLNLLSSRWFISVMLIVFIAVFGGLVTWQYGKDIRALFAPIKQAPKSQTTAAPGDAFADLLNGEETGQPSSAASETAEQAGTSPDRAAPSADTLVTDWPDAVSSLSEDEGADTQPLPSAATQPKPAEKQNETDGAVSLTAAQQQTRAASDTQATPASTPTEATDAIAESADTESPSVLIADSTTLLEQIRANDFYIQMAGLSDKSLLSQFISDNKLRDLTHVYHTYRYGGDWFVVLFHQPFTSLQQAKSAMQQLPDYQGRAQAFVKNGGQIRQELTSAPASDE